MTAPILAWGLQPPEGVKVAWGTRTIYRYDSDPKRIGIDILWDRQDRRGLKEELEPLLAWVDSTGMTALRQELARSEVVGDSPLRAVVRSDKGFVIEASPNASYGYLYIVAYVKP